MAKDTKKTDVIVDVDAPEITESGIEVNDPETFRPKTLPLIIKLPPDASKAQIERAKVLNSYAYSHPERWRERKEQLIKELEALKFAPDPIENPDQRMSVGPKAPSNII